MLLDEIANFLQSKGIGTIGTNLFKAKYPDEPDLMTVVLDSGGYPPDLHAPISYPTFQIITRSEDYTAAMQKAEDCYAQLHGLTETVLTGRRYLLIQAMQEPTSMGRDSTGREMITCNYAATVEKPTPNR